MADLDYDSALTLSATAMRRAMESEDPTFAVVSAIESLRIALLAAERDLVEALDERAALANGTRVVVVDDKADDDEPCEGNCGHCGGYFCEVHDIHISCSHPDYDLLVDEHEAMHAEEQDEAAAGQVMAATEIRQYLDTVETALQDPKFAAADATRRLIRVVRAGIAAGAAPATLIAMLTALLAEEADQ